MPPEFKYDVFISHNSADKPWVRRLVKALSRRTIAGKKLSIFFDEVSIPLGESIPSALRRAADSSRHILCIMTPEWLRSEWCNMEHDIAEWSDPSGKRHCLLPILLKDCEMPSSLKRLRYIDFRTRKMAPQKLRELFESIKEGQQKSVSYPIEHHQTTDSLNHPLLPWAMNSPSLSMLWPKLFVDPRIMATKQSRTQYTLSEWLTLYDWKSHIAIVGSPGSGKTTALRHLQLATADGQYPSSPRPVIITTIAELSRLNRSSRGNLISKLHNAHGTTAPRPVPKKVLLLVDALDEASQLDSDRGILALLKLIRSGNVVWLASRGDSFFRRIEASPRLASIFSEVLQLQPWNPEKDSLPFVARIAEKLGDRNLFQSIRRFTQSPDCMPWILTNPFRLSLLVYLFSSHPLATKPTAHHLASSYSLYRTFYENWLERERHRGTSTLRAESIRAQHRALAMRFYESGNAPLPLTTAIRPATKKRLKDFLSDSSYSGLLAFEETRPNQRIVTGFLHETLTEFLVAESILISLQKGGKALLESMLTVYRYEVNTFIREAFYSLSHDASAAVSLNLTRLYCRLDGNAHSQTKGVKSTEAIRIQEQALYYLGRLATRTNGAFLVSAYRKQGNLLLRRVAAIGAILHGCVEVELHFVETLVPASAMDVHNRSVQLCYFGDVPDALDEFVDDGRADWSRTREAIYHRLTQSDERALRLRLWDLRTLRLFYWSRKAGSLITHGQRKILKQAIVTWAGIDERKQRALKREKSALLKLASTLSK